MTEPLLSVRDLVSGYGSTRVLRGVSLDVPEGDVVSLIGRNGVGKTTTLRTILGTVTPTAGRVTFDCEPRAVLKLDGCTGGVLDHSAVSESDQRVVAYEEALVAERGAAHLGPVEVDEKRLEVHEAAAGAGQDGGAAAGGHEAEPVAGEVEHGAGGAGLKLAPRKAHRALHVT